MTTQPIATVEMSPELIQRVINDISVRPMTDDNGTNQLQIGFPAWFTHGCTYSEETIQHIKEMITHNTIQYLEDENFKPTGDVVEVQGE